VRNTLRVLKSLACPISRTSPAKTAAIALPDECCGGGAVVANASKTRNLSAQERSCASERGGALFLLREAIQHWLSTDVEPQLCAHMALVQVHRRDCTDRRRRPPPLSVTIGE
jgi:hypothetical protein